MIFELSVVDRSVSFGAGYIAGTGDGIVTVAGVPSSRAVYLYAVYQYKPMEFVTQVWSNEQGRYMFSSIDENQQYLVMVRDVKREYEPFVWDYVKPANDLTIVEQQAILQSWKN